MIGKDKPEDALRYLKACEKLADKNPSQIDTNYIAVMQYNIACSYQRIGMPDECIKHLNKAIEILTLKLTEIKDKKNASFIVRIQTSSIDSVSSVNSEYGQQESILGNELHKYRYMCKFHL